MRKRNVDKIMASKIHYSVKRLMNKLKHSVEIFCAKVVYYTLLLYNLLKSMDEPVKHKALIVGALGYLVLPLDIIPDALPVVGFADDLRVLVYATHAVCNYVTPAIKQKAKAQLSELFYTYHKSDLTFE